MVILKMMFDIPISPLALPGISHERGTGYIGNQTSKDLIFMLPKIWLWLRNPITGLWYGMVRAKEH